MGCLLVIGGDGKGADLRVVRGNKLEKLKAVGIWSESLGHKKGKVI